LSGSLNGMFDFSSAKPQNLRKVVLDPETGLVRSGN